MLARMTVGSRGSARVAAVESGTAEPAATEESANAVTPAVARVESTPEGVPTRAISDQRLSEDPPAGEPARISTPDGEVGPSAGADGGPPAGPAPAPSAGWAVSACTTSQGYGTSP